MSVNLSSDISRQERTVFTSSTVSKGKLLFINFSKQFCCSSFPVTNSKGKADFAERGLLPKDSPNHCAR